MDAYSEKKNNIIEGLMSLTLRMIESIRNEDINSFEDRLQNRSELYKKLDKLEKLLGNQSTSLDAQWAAQLLHIRRLDETLKQLLEKTQTSNEEQLTQLQSLRSELVRNHFGDLRGRRLEIEG